MALLKPFLLTIAMIMALSVVTGEGYITKEKAKGMKLTKLVKELRENRVTIN